MALKTFKPTSAGRRQLVLVDRTAYGIKWPLTDHFALQGQPPARGDIITFSHPQQGHRLIKRVVAVAGDRVAMRGNQLILNGVPVPRTLQDAHRPVDSELGPLDLQVWRESQGSVRYETANLPAMNQLRDFAPITVPAGHVLVLGDSRDNSRDSRYIGFIDVERITGRAERVVLSHNIDRVYLPRADRWWLSLHL